MSPEKRYEDNIKLAYWVVSRHFPNLTWDEDIRQEACIGLWKAAKTFNDTLGVKFSTYADTCIRNSCLMELRRRKRANKMVVVSHDAPIPGNGGMFYSDTIVDLNDMIENSINNISIERCLTQTEKDVYLLKEIGYTHIEIAKNFGRSSSWVAEQLKKARSKLAKALLF